MAYFHSRSPKSPAGKPKWKVVGDKVEEILTLGREYPEVKTIVPDRRNTKITSKSQAIYALVPYERTDILEKIDSTAVSDLHISVMSMILREENWGTRFGHTDSSRAYFTREIRGKTIQLLTRGAWIDEPSSLGLKKWNNRVENLDLGRRSDLKFSSTQSERLKYDADAKREDLGASSEEDWIYEYRNASPEKRKEIFQELMPWRKPMILEKFGEP